VPQRVNHASQGRRLRPSSPTSPRRSRQCPACPLRRAAPPRPPNHTRYVAPRRPLPVLFKSLSRRFVCPLTRAGLAPCLPSVASLKRKTTASRYRGLYRQMCCRCKASRQPVRCRATPQLSSGFWKRAESVQQHVWASRGLVTLVQLRYAVAFRLFQRATSRELCVRYCQGADTAWLCGVGVCVHACV